MLRHGPATCNIALCYRHSIASATDAEPIKGNQLSYVHNHGSLNSSVIAAMLSFTKSKMDVVGVLMKCHLLILSEGGACAICR